MIQPSDYPYDASDPFGNKQPPRTYPHTGSDWLAPTGSNVYAVDDGVIVATGTAAGNGVYIAQSLMNGLYWSYIHLTEYLVRPGDNVARGQVIARSGNTGTNSRGPHLHCSLSDSPQVYAGLGNLQDPYAYLMAHPNQQNGDDDVASQFFVATSDSPTGSVQANQVWVRPEPGAALHPLTAGQAHDWFSMLKLDFNAPNVFAKDGSWFDLAFQEDKDMAALYAKTHTPTVPAAKKPVTKK